MVNIARTLFGLDKAEPADKIQDNTRSINKESKKKLIALREKFSSEEE